MNVSKPQCITGNIGPWAFDDVIAVHPLVQRLRFRITHDQQTHVRGCVKSSFEERQTGYTEVDVSWQGHNRGGDLIW